MQVEYLVRISLPDEGWDVNMLEEACWKAGREASQKLFVLALEKRDEEVVAQTKGSKKGRSPHYLVTRFGVITIRREKVNQGWINEGLATQAQRDPGLLTSPAAVVYRSY